MTVRSRADDRPKIDSLVLFKNCRGGDGRGTVVHLTRAQIVFEVYNPYSIVQLSEILSDLRILRGERTIYDGRGVVSNLVATGLMVIVSATLIDPWTDLSGLAPGQGLNKEANRFIEDWESGHNIRPAYQLCTGRIRDFLAELSRWLEQSEVMLGESDDSEPAKFQSEFLQEVQEPILPKLKDFFVEFEEEAINVPPEELLIHKAYAQRELHPLMLCSPIVHQTFTKPLGYAGDYQIVNMMLRNPDIGSNVYAKIINTFNYNSPPAEAHRNRISILLDLLAIETGNKLAERKKFHMLDVGCGPGTLIERFIGSDDGLQNCHFDLLDFNEETLDHARDRLRQIGNQQSNSPQINYIHKSIHELLKEARARNLDAEPRYDLVNCAGLFDYLSDRVCKRLVQLYWRWLRPGGLLIVTNVHPYNPAQKYMEHVLEWHLEYRNEANIRKLADGLDLLEVFTDPTGVNVFLTARKPNQ